MTATAAAAHPSDFNVVSKRHLQALVPTTVDVPINKQVPLYSVFSLIPTVHLPTIADTGATQHTTN